MTLFSVVGGGSLLLGAFGITLFRASNRYSIFICTVVLLWLAMWLSEARRTWLPLACLGVLLTLGAFDQVGSRVDAVEKARHVGMWRSDEAFAAEMSQQLPPGAMVFEMPVVSFPESPPIHQLCDYALFRPYLFTRTLRYSYGTHKGRFQDSWQQRVAPYPLPDLVSTLEANGFSALLVFRAGFADDGAEYLRYFAQRGVPPLAVSPDKALVAYRLRPSATPVLPEEAVFPFTFARDWYPRDYEPFTGGAWWWWAKGGEAEMVLTPQAPVGTTVTVRMVVGTLAPRKVAVFVDQEPRGVAEIPAKGTNPLMLRVTVREGGNRIGLRTDVPAVPDAERERRPVTFMVANPRCVVE